MVARYVNNHINLDNDVIATELSNCKKEKKYEDNLACLDLSFTTALSLFFIIFIALVRVS